MAILENIEQIEQNEKLSKTEEKLTKEMKNPINEEPAKKVVDSTNKTLTNLAKKNFDSILKEHGLNIKDFLKKQNINIPDNNIESLKNLNDAEKANIATYIAQIEVGNEIAKLTTSVGKGKDLTIAQITTIKNNRKWKLSKIDPVSNSYEYKEVQGIVQKLKSDFDRAYKQQEHEYKVWGETKIQNLTKQFCSLLEVSDDLQNFKSISAGDKSDTLGKDNKTVLLGVNPNEYNAEHPEYQKQTIYRKKDQSTMNISLLASGADWKQSSIIKITAKTKNGESITLTGETSKEQQNIQRKGDSGVFKINEQGTVTLDSSVFDTNHAPTLTLKPAKYTIDNIVAGSRETKTSYDEIQLNISTNGEFSKEKIKVPVMKDIMGGFEANQSEITKELKNKLENEIEAIKRALKNNPDLNIKIDGWASSEGNEKHNQSLSENRAKAIKNFFTSKGISAEKIQTTGYGETEKWGEKLEDNRRIQLTYTNSI